MSDFKNKIASTIFLPNFLKESLEPNTEDIIKLVFKILDLYHKGISEQNYMKPNMIWRVCSKIDHISMMLKDISSSDFYLQCWLFIGETVNEWISISIECEEFEVATNLRKLFNNEYV